MWVLLVLLSLWLMKRRHLWLLVVVRVLVDLRRVVVEEPGRLMLVRMMRVVVRVGVGVMVLLLLMLLRMGKARSTTKVRATLDWCMVRLRLRCDRPVCGGH